MEGKEIVVWFSCGAGSAVAAMLAVEKYGQTNNVRIVNNPVAEEHEDNRRFLKDVEKAIGQKIEVATNKNFPSHSAIDVWEKKKYMSGVKGAPCTLELKKKARQQFEDTNKCDWHVLGFTADERSRYENFIKTERPNTLPVLIENGITKDMCFEILKATGIKLPEIYNLGYPNANCIGCVKATSPTYWNHVRRVHPNIFEQRAEQSRRIGARLVRVAGTRLFLDELDLSARGRPMKNVSIECSSFCEEKLK